MTQGDNICASSIRKFPTGLGKFEWRRKQVTQLKHTRSINLDWQVAPRKLSNNLSASSTRHPQLESRSLVGVYTRQCHRVNSPMPCRDCLEDRIAFGAYRQAIGCVLDVTSGEHLVAHPDGRANAEVGIWRVGVPGYRTRYLQQRSRCSHDPSLVPGESDLNPAANS